MSREQDIQPPLGIQSVRLYDAARKITESLFTFSTISITGQENLPEETVLIAANHRGFNDVPAISFAAADRRIQFMGKRELFSVPLFGRLIKKTGTIPVDRKDPKPETLHAMISTLRGGNTAAIFPEGKVYTGRKIHRIRRGIGIIACFAEVPVVPVGIAYKESIGKRIWPTSMHIHVGEPIEPETLPIEYSLDLDLSFSGNGVMRECLKKISSTTRNVENGMQSAYDIALSHYDTANKAHNTR